jgi:hypothetical protein
MSVAAKFVSAIPVIQQQQCFYSEDRWKDWLERHLLTRTDGLWLCDRRDPEPSYKSKWACESGRNNKVWELSDDAFFDALTNGNPAGDSICVVGRWEDSDEHCCETIRIASALVNSDVSSSLATALRTAEDPNHYRLPDYGDRENEYQQKPFELEGWLINEYDSSGRLDRFDPYAKDLDYPPPQVGESYRKALEITSDDEQRIWISKEGMAVAHCEIWSDKQHSERESPFRRGKRMAASLKLLQTLCKQFSKHLVIEVLIQRTGVRRQFTSSEDNEGYQIPSHKIFVLSAKGILNDGRKNYQVGKEIGNLLLQGPA